MTFVFPYFIDKQQLNQWQPVGSSTSNRDGESSGESWKSVAAFKSFTQGQEENMSGFITDHTTQEFLWLCLV